MTYRKLLSEGESFLKDCGVPDPEVDARLLLDFCTGMDRTAWLLHSADQVPQDLPARYRALLKERGRRIPLQHITGEQYFMGFPFRVDGRVLIPRQDTEVLVEEALRGLRAGDRVLDLCTGSGCILISLMKLQEGLEGTGSDLSGEALDAARDNAARLGVAAEFIQSDLFTALPGSYDLIVSNPPYIARDQIPELMEEVRDHDPRMALDGGPDGLSFYRRITEQAPDHLVPGGRLLFEIGSGQAREVSRLMEAAGFSRIRVLQDLAGLDRVVAGQLGTGQLGISQRETDQPETSQLGTGQPG